MADDKDRQNAEQANISPDSRFVFDNTLLSSEQTELSNISDIWRKLLGIHPMDAYENIEGAQPSSTLLADPWSELLHSKDVEVVDLQKVHHHKDALLTDADVEQALQLMQEQPFE
ncbi:MAG: hypothetical protein M3Z24_01775 [Chloroflexota bacterium]|nr:hypothetical protein [Chloroflexota bacterium]